MKIIRQVTAILIASALSATGFANERTGEASETNLTPFSASSEIEEAAQDLEFISNKRKTDGFTSYDISSLRGEMTSVNEVEVSNYVFLEDGSLVPVSATVSFVDKTMEVIHRGPVSHYTNLQIASESEFIMSSGNQFYYLLKDHQPLP